MAITINSSNLLEFSLGFIGILGAISSFSFFLANLKIQANSEKQISDLAKEMQRRHDYLKVEIKVHRASLRDIENFLQKNHEFSKRSEIMTDQFFDDPPTNL